MYVCLCLCAMCMWIYFAVSSFHFLTWLLRFFSPYLPFVESQILVKLFSPEHSFPVSLSQWLLLFLFVFSFYSSDVIQLTLHVVIFIFFFVNYYFVLIIFFWSLYLFWCCRRVSTHWFTLHSSRTYFSSIHTRTYYVQNVVPSTPSDNKRNSIHFWSLSRAVVHVCGFKIASVNLFLPVNSSSIRAWSILSKKWANERQKKNEKNILCVFFLFASYFRI